MKPASSQIAEYLELESKALKIAMKALQDIKAMKCVCDIDPKQCAQCDAYIALEKIDSIFNPKDIAKLDGGEPAAEKL